VGKKGHKAFPPVVEANAERVCLPGRLFLRRHNRLAVSTFGPAPPLVLSQHLIFGLGG
jgi:hypothetical protein